MPVSVVVGGQYGSEGKGKVALHIARMQHAEYVVRTGGTNSGHTGIDESHVTRALRQLPAAVLAPDAIAVLPPGALIDPEIFQREVEILRLNRDRLIVSPLAMVISLADREREQSAGLVTAIGSTGSGTGAALIRRLWRRSGSAILAGDHPAFAPFLGDTTEIMRGALDREARIVIEGTQGFGLSVLHGGYYPKATSRDTTAAGFLSEAGLSPLDVDDVTLVVRAHPIRVAGDSGPFDGGETSWAEIAKSAGLPEDYCELTTATKKVRRVGHFHAAVVARAIAVNCPSRLVLNHFDYIDEGVRHGRYSASAINILQQIEKSIGARFDWVGIGPDQLVQRADVTSPVLSSNLEEFA